jgi:hypothetical protein
MTTMTFANILDHLRFTLQNPREGVRQVIALDLPINARWTALALMAVVSAIMTHLSFGLLTPDQRAMAGGMIASPFRTAIVQGLVMLVLVAATFWVGRARGGRGSFADALVAMAWLQFILLCLQAVQLVAQVLLPPLGELIGVAGLAIFLWLLTNFVAELHGFGSRLAVFGGIVATAFVLGFLLSILLVMLGGGPVGGP